MTLIVAHFHKNIFQSTSCIASMQTNMNSVSKLIKSIMHKNTKSIVLLAQCLIVQTTDSDIVFKNKSIQCCKTKEVPFYHWTVTMTFPNHLVDHNRDFIVYDRLLLLSLQYGRPLSMFYESVRLLISRHFAVAEIRFFTLTFQCGESEKVQNVTASFQSIVVGGRSSFDNNRCVSSLVKKLYCSLIWIHI